MITGTGQEDISLSAGNNKNKKINHRSPALSLKKLHHWQWKSKNNIKINNKEEISTAADEGF